MRELGAAVGDGIEVMDFEARARGGALPATVPVALTNRLRVGPPLGAQQGRPGGPLVTPTS